MATAPAVIIGALPAWLALGPVEFRDGVPVRPVLGDWSHRHECDQLPAFIVDSPAAVASSPRPLGPRQPSPDPVHSLPGKSIAELKGIHSGKVALLFNGPSLSEHDLFRIPCPIIGMNRTHAGNKGYVGPQPDYLCVIDEVWMRNQNVLAHPGLINGSVNPAPVGYRAPRHFRASPFSFDLAHDGYVPVVPGTTGFLALQLAIYMGFDALFCLGLDLSGTHFDASPGSHHYKWMARHFLRMAPLIAARDIRVTICGSPESQCAAFTHSTFEELCA